MVTYPSDWSTFSFDEMFQLYPNNTLSRDKLSEHGEIGNIHYGDVLIKYGAVLSAKDPIPKIKTEYESGARAFLQQNDIIVADTAEDETVGKVVQIGEIPFPLVGGLHTIVCRPLVPTATGYLGYYMNSKEYHDQLLPYITGIKVSSVSKTSIRKTELHVPSTVKEQAAIVNAIGSFDTHIANLAELIDKKKAIRDGALEDLVSGRTRLAGYTNDWDKTTIGACAEIFQGGTPSTTNSQFWGGNVIWVTPSEITKLSTMYIDDSERKITEEGVQNSSAKILPVGTILLCTRATIGDLAIAKKPMTTNQGFKNLVCNSGVHNVFFAYLLRTLKPTMLSLAIGTTFLEISKKNLSTIEISIPNYPEQKAIADVLTAMDDEIRDLENERDKMIQIREGAMDDLLTGRVRLKV